MPRACRALLRPGPGSWLDECGAALSAHAGRYRAVPRGQDSDGAGRQGAASATLAPRRGRRACQSTFAFACAVVCLRCLAPSPSRLCSLAAGRALVSGAVDKRAEGPLRSEQPNSAADLKLIMGGKFLDNNDLLEGAAPYAHRSSCANRSGRGCGPHLHASAQRGRGADVLASHFGEGSVVTLHVVVRPATPGRATGAPLPGWALALPPSVCGEL